MKTKNKEHDNCFERWPWARSVGRDTLIMRETLTAVNEPGMMYAICDKCKQTFQAIDILDDSRCPGCGLQQIYKEHNNNG